jgi:hypothetical protein
VGEFATQSLAIFIANSSLYSKSKLRFAIVLLPRPKSFRRNAWNPQLVAAWNLALASMESMPIALYGIKTEGKGDARQAVMPYARWAMPYNEQSSLIPCQALRSWIKTPPYPVV